MGLRLRCIPVIPCTLLQYQCIRIVCGSSFRPRSTNIMQRRHGVYVASLLIANASSSCQYEGRLSCDVCRRGKSRNVASARGQRCVWLQNSGRGPPGPHETTVTTKGLLFDMHAAAEHSIVNVGSPARPAAAAYREGCSLSFPAADQSRHSGAAATDGGSRIAGCITLRVPGR